VSPDDAATVVFTSGTTGAPKGVVLTHRNVVYEATALLAANNLTDAGTSVSYLPFAHIAERMLSMYLPYVAGGQVRLLADASELAETLRELRPTRFFGVPRIWEKIQTWVSADDGAGDEFNTAEVQAALAFLNDSAVGPGHAPAWSELAHVLFNVKEFIFIP